MSGKPPVPNKDMFKRLNKGRINLMRERSKYYDVLPSEIVAASQKVKKLDNQIADITKKAKEVLAQNEKEKKELDKVRDIIHTKGIVAAKTQRQGGKRGKTRRTRVKKS